MVPLCALTATPSKVVSRIKANNTGHSVSTVLSGYTTGHGFNAADYGVKVLVRLEGVTRQSSTSRRVSCEPTPRRLSLEAPPLPAMLLLVFAAWRCLPLVYDCAAPKKAHAIQAAIKKRRGAAPEGVRTRRWRIN